MRVIGRGLWKPCHCCHSCHGEVAEELKNFTQVFAILKLLPCAETWPLHCATFSRSKRYQRDFRCPFFKIDFVAAFRAIRYDAINLCYM